MSARQIDGSGGFEGGAMPRCAPREGGIKGCGLLLGICFIFLACHGPISERAFGAEKPLLFLGDSAYPPVTYLQGGEPKGMEVDLVRALATEMNREIRIELTEWNSAQKRVLNGEADALLGMSITEDRKSRFDFANATFAHEFGLLARRDNLAIHGFKQLKGRKVGVTAGRLPRQVLEAQPGINFVIIQNYREGLDALKSGQIDAMGADLRVAAFFIEKDHIRGIRMIGRPFATTPAAIAVREGNTNLLNQINRALNRMQLAGRLEEIEARWRPHDVVFLSRERVRNLTIFGSAVFAAVLLGTLAGWIFTLKMQVRSRLRAEQALRESEQRLRTLTDASFEGVGICQDGILIDANDQLIKMLGYERSEIIGKPVIELVAPDSRELVRQATESAVSQPYEHMAIRKDGGTFPVEVCGRLISRAPHHIRVTAVRDISERKQAEERLQLLQMITMDITATSDVAAALTVVLRRVCEKTGWTLGQAWMPDTNGTALICCPAFFATDPSAQEFQEASRPCNFAPGAGLPGRVWQSRAPVWVQDVTKDDNFPRLEAARRCGIKAAIGVPILSQDEVTAVLEFFLREPRQEEERLVRVITAVAAQLGLVLERKCAEEEMRASREELRALAGRLQAVREEERTRIAREIHDILAQDLTRMKIDLGWLAKRIGQEPNENDPRAIGEKISHLNSLADSTIHTVQRIAAELRPVVLDSLGLFAAIDWLAEDFQARANIRCEAILPDEEIELPRESATGLFRIVQESLTNVIRHSEASRVEIVLEVDASDLRLMVRDNGVGFNEKRMRDAHSLGLLGMRERALLLDADFQIRGEPGKGTVVSVTMPIPRFARPSIAADPGEQSAAA